MPRLGERRDLVERLLEKYEIDEITGCLMFVVGQASAEYPRVRVHDGERWRYVTHHRLMYELFVGPIPDGLNVLHTCDVKRCGYVEHLYVGTTKRNAQDRSERLPRKATCVHGHALTDDNVYLLPNPNCPSRPWRKCATCVRSNQAAYRERKSLCLVG